MVAILVGLAAAIILWVWLARRADIMAPPGVPSATWRHLVHIAGGDVERARALIEGEKRRNPGISERAACQRAIQSYQRDNR